MTAHERRWMVRGATLKPKAMRIDEITYKLKMNNICPRTDLETDVFFVFICLFFKRTTCRVRIGCDRRATPHSATSQKRPAAETTSSTGAGTGTSHYTSTGTESGDNEHGGLITRPHGRDKLAASMIAEKATAGGRKR